MSTQKKITLNELLILIAIIVILAASLFPMFAQARSAAKKTVSMSIVKQTSVGIFINGNDCVANS